MAPSGPPGRASRGGDWPSDGPERRGPNVAVKSRYDGSSPLDGDGVCGEGPRKRGRMEVPGGQGAASEGVAHASGGERARARDSDLGTFNFGSNGRPAVPQSGGRRRGAGSSGGVARAGGDGGGGGETVRQSAAVAGVQVSSPDGDPAIFDRGSNGCPAVPQSGTWRQDDARGGGRRVVGASGGAARAGGSGDGERNARQQAVAAAVHVSPPGDSGCRLAAVDSGSALSPAGRMAAARPAGPNAAVHAPGGGGGGGAAPTGGGVGGSRKGGEATEVQGEASREVTVVFTAAGAGGGVREGGRGGGATGAQRRSRWDQADPLAFREARERDAQARLRAASGAAAAVQVSPPGDSVRRLAAVDSGSALSPAGRMAVARPAGPNAAAHAPGGGGGGGAAPRGGGAGGGGEGGEATEVRGVASGGVAAGRLRGFMAAGAGGVREGGRGGGETGTLGGVEGSVAAAAGGGGRGGEAAGSRGTVGGGGGGAAPTGGGVGGGGEGGEATGLRGVASRGVVAGFMVAGAGGGVHKGDRGGGATGTPGGVEGSVTAAAGGGGGGGEAAGPRGVAGGSAAAAASGVGGVPTEAERRARVVTIGANGVPAAGERVEAGGWEAGGEEGRGSGSGALGDQDGLALGRAGEDDRERFDVESDDGRAQQRGTQWGQADAFVFSGRAIVVWSLLGLGPDGPPQEKVAGQEARARDAQARSSALRVDRMAAAAAGVAPRAVEAQRQAAADDVAFAELLSLSRMQSSCIRQRIAFWMQGLTHYPGGGEVHVFLDAGGARVGLAPSDEALRVLNPSTKGLQNRRCGSVQEAATWLGGLCSGACAECRVALAAARSALGVTLAQDVSDVGTRIVYLEGGGRVMQRPVDGGVNGNCGCLSAATVAALYCSLGSPEALVGGAYTFLQATHMGSVATWNGENGGAFFTQGRKGQHKWVKNLDEAVSWFFIEACGNGCCGAALAAVRAGICARGSGRGAGVQPAAVPGATRPVLMGQGGGVAVATGGGPGGGYSDPREALVPAREAPLDSAAGKCAGGVGLGGAALGGTDGEAAGQRRPERGRAGALQERPETPAPAQEQRGAGGSRPEVPFLLGEGSRGGRDGGDWGRASAAFRLGEGSQGGGGERAGGRRGAPAAWTDVACAQRQRRFADRRSQERAEAVEQRRSQRPRRQDGQGAAAEGAPNGSGDTGGRDRTLEAPHFGGGRGTREATRPAWLGPSGVITGALREGAGAHGAGGGRGTWGAAGSAGTSPSGVVTGAGRERDAARPAGVGRSGVTTGGRGVAGGGWQDEARVAARRREGVTGRGALLILDGSGYIGIDSAAGGGDARSSMVLTREASSTLELDAERGSLVIAGSAWCAAGNRNIAFTSPGQLIGAVWERRVGGGGGQVEEGGKVWGAVGEEGDGDGFEIRMGERRLRLWEGRLVWMALRRRGESGTTDALFRWDASVGAPSLTREPLSVGLSRDDGRRTVHTAVVTAPEGTVVPSRAGDGRGTGSVVPRWRTRRGSGRHASRPFHAVVGASLAPSGGRLPAEAVGASLALGTPPAPSSAAPGARRGGRGAVTFRESSVDAARVATRAGAASPPGKLTPVGQPPRGRAPAGRPRVETVAAARGGGSQGREVLSPVPDVAARRGGTGARGDAQPEPADVVMREGVGAGARGDAQPDVVMREGAAFSPEEADTAASRGGPGSHPLGTDCLETTLRALGVGGQPPREQPRAALPPLHPSPGEVCRAAEVMAATPCRQVTSSTFRRDGIHAGDPDEPAGGYLEEQHIRDRRRDPAGLDAGQQVVFRRLQNACTAAGIQGLATVMWEDGVEEVSQIAHVSAEQVNTEWRVPRDLEDRVWRGLEQMAKIAGFKLPYRFVTGERGTEWTAAGPWTGLASLSLRTRRQLAWHYPEDMVAFASPGQQGGHAAPQLAPEATPLKHDAHNSVGGGACGPNTNAEPLAGARSGPGAAPERPRDSGGREAPEAVSRRDGGVFRFGEGKQQGRASLVGAWRAQPARLPQSCDGGGEAGECDGGTVLATPFCGTLRAGNGAYLCLNSAEGAGRAASSVASSIVYYDEKRGSVSGRPLRRGGRMMLAGDFTAVHVVSQRDQPQAWAAFDIVRCGFGGDGRPAFHLAAREAQGEGRRGSATGFGGGTRFAYVYVGFRVGGSAGSVGARKGAPGGGVGAPAAPSQPARERARPVVSPASVPRGPGRGGGPGPRPRGVGAPGGVRGAAPPGACPADGDCLLGTTPVPLRAGGFCAAQDLTRGVVLQCGAVIACVVVTEVNAGMLLVPLPSGGAVTLGHPARVRTDSVGAWSTAGALSRDRVCKSVGVLVNLVLAEGTVGFQIGGSEFAAYGNGDLAAGGAYYARDIIPHLARLPGWDVGRVTARIDAQGQVVAPGSAPPPGSSKQRLRESIRTAAAGGLQWLYTDTKGSKMWLAGTDISGSEEGLDFGKGAARTTRTVRYGSIIGISAALLSPRRTPVARAGGQTASELGSSERTADNFGIYGTDGDSEGAARASEYLRRHQDEQLALHDRNGAVVSVLSCGDAATALPGQATTDTVLAALMAKACADFAPDGRVEGALVIVLPAHTLQQLAAVTNTAGRARLQYADPSDPRGPWARGSLVELFGNRRISDEECEVVLVNCLHAHYTGYVFAVGRGGIAVQVIDGLAHDRSGETTDLLTLLRMRWASEQQAIGGGHAATAFPLVRGVAPATAFARQVTGSNDCMWVAYLSVLQRMRARPVTPACASEIAVRSARLAFLRSLHPIDHQNQNQNQNVLTCTSGAVTTTSTRPHPFLGGEQ